MEWKRDRLILKLFIVVSLVGLVVASYQTYEHYFVASSICDFTQTFSCSAVTESAYGEFPKNSGIAVAAYGVVWWVGVIFLSVMMLRGWRLKNPEFYLFLWMMVGLGSILYLLFIEFYVLPMETGVLAICPLCTVQHILIFFMIPFSFLLLKKSFSKYFDNIFYKKVGKKTVFNAKPVFVIATTGFIMLAAYLILFGGGEINYYEFAGCLSSRNATMYGFDACPNCNKQEHVIGLDAFKTFIEDEGLYVKCRPDSEALAPVGKRISRVSVLPEYVGAFSESTTQGELCVLMVSSGTPTWIINGIQLTGWKTIRELAEVSGCPVPSNLLEGSAKSGGVTMVD